MQNITGYTKVYGIIADPIRHSISPLMHNTAFGALGIDGVYVAFETPEEQFDAGVRGLKALGIRALTCPCLTNGGSWIIWTRFPRRPGWPER